LEKYAGNILTFTCRNIKADDIMILGMKLVILSHEKSKRLKESEVKKLGEFIGTKMNKIFDCVMDDM